MRWLGVLLIVLATALPVLAEDWTTADGKTYKNVTVIALEDDGVRVTYTGGAGKLPYYELSLELQKRFGQDIDSLEAKRKAAEKALADATRNAEAAAAAQKKQQDETAAMQLQKNQQAGNTAPPSAQPSAPVQPVQPAAVTPPPAPPVQVAEKEPYPGSKFRYEESLDLCYLDSPAVEIVPVLLEATPGAPPSPGQNASLALRIATEGRKPEAPDRFEVTFRSASGVKKPAGASSIKFLVDGTYIPVSEMADNEGDNSSGAGQLVQTAVFYLSPEQARSIFHGNKVNFSLGSNDYRIDPPGIALFRKYFDDVDHLPPASTNVMRAFHRFLVQLPSIITIISTVCEYIVLGSFGILAAASIAAFVLGVSRFMKM